MWLSYESRWQPVSIKMLLMTRYMMFPTWNECTEPGYSLLYRELPLSCLQLSAVVRKL
jgi:hypothetical protein